MTSAPTEIIARQSAADPTFNALGMTIESVIEGRVTVALEVRDDMLNAAQVAHGGWIFLLADTAFGFAAGTIMPGAVTAEADIRFHRPAMPASRLTAEAVVAERTRSTALIDVAISDEKGHRLASFRGTARAPRGSA